MTEKEFKVILQEGEGYRIEFKEALANLDKELVAFSNGSGGRIFLGIDDQKNVKGVTLYNRLKSQIQDIANNCQPPVRISFEEFRNVLIITVREGEDKPYKCSFGFYIRVGPNSQKLNRDEIVAFIKSEGKVRFDELVCSKFDFKKHFDRKKLDRFLGLAGITRSLDVPAMLENLDAAERQEGKTIVNNTGALFFSKNLSDIYKHTVVTCALYRGTEKVDVLDRKDFNEDTLSNIDQAMIFLKRHLSLRYEITGAPRRKEVLEIPEGALREAVINAVAHRDYFERGANAMVEIFDDRVEITNPGGLVKGLKPEDFGKKSILRNPNIASLLHRAEYIEKMGTGITRMRNLMREAGLPVPQFEFSSFFTITLKRPVRKTLPEDFGVNFGVNFGVKFGLKGHRLERIVGILQMLMRNQPITASEAAVLFKATKRTTENDIGFLRLNQLVEFVGPPKTGRYILTTKGRKLIKELRSQK